MKLFTKLMFGWLIVGLTFALISVLFIKFEYPIIYFLIVIIIFGGLFYILQNPLRTKLKQWSSPPLLKFVVLGYGAVLTEELFAALVNHLTEGFNTTLYLQRILQFWAFNILAFSGLIFGWYFLTKKIKYTQTEIFFLTGVFGLWAERIFQVILTNPLAFIFWAPLVIFVYGIIITPAMFSLELETATKRLNPILKYPLTYLIIFLCSLLPIIILWHLRNSYPWAFPPASFIPA